MEQVQELKRENSSRLKRTASGKYLGSHRFQPSRSVAMMVHELAEEKPRPSSEKDVRLRKISAQE